jgi:flap endonuclease-1
MLGLCCLQADGEAETLCAYLAINGDVDVVLTEDTDVLAYGTPFMMAYKDFKLGEGKIYGLFLPTILEALEMNEDEFRDLCILLSCDYNERVQGYPPNGKTHKKPKGIGLKGAICMIKEYRRLEEVSNYVVDMTPLKYRRCRELFTIPTEIPFAIVPFNEEPDFEELNKFCTKNRLTVTIEYIRTCWKPTEIIYDDWEELSSEDDESTSSESSFTDINDIEQFLTKSPPKRRFLPSI